jgi:RNA polymerase sigma-70 factor (ECF subfamily)
VGISPAQSVEGSEGECVPDRLGAIDGTLLDELWNECEGASWGLERGEFKEILLDVGTAQNYGLASSGCFAAATGGVLSEGSGWPTWCWRACAAGNERAWERFVATYRQPLVRAAIAITGSDTLGRDLADQLYAELYGLTTRDGERRCPLQSYRGRGSLIGWLRTTLAQRHVDHYRGSHREQPLEELRYSGTGCRG